MFSNYSKLLLGLILLSFNSLKAQLLTSEDSLAVGLDKKQKSDTYISGYGEAVVSYNTRTKLAMANLTRNVLFVGHRFSDRVNFFSEWELENAKVSGGEPGGEIALEQMLLQFDLSSNNSISAGLLTPRIGIINENHLPTTFNSNSRPVLETILIPSTWRELGIYYSGNSKKASGLNYTLGIFNGLNSAAFTGGSGIREGRFEGRDATASNIAVTGSLLYYVNNFRIQASTYYGGSAGINKTQSDTLQLKNGLFGTPVSLTEANIQYSGSKLSVKILGAFLSIPDAFKINRAYNNNTPKQAFGAYAELAYNIASLLKLNETHQLNIFCRAEYIDLNSRVVANGIESDELKKLYIFAGINYKPVAGVIIKADYRYSQTGNPNPLLVKPEEVFYKTNGLVSVGFGYSF